MNFDALFHILNNQMIKQQNHHFSSVETIILRGILEHKTYREMSQKEGYSCGYLTNVVAPELYQRLSKLLGASVNKKNCLQKLEVYVKNKNKKKEKFIVKVPNRNELKEFFTYPNSSISLHSPYYVRRNIIEKQIIEEIRNPGGLVIIKSPRNMGKTSLVLRILEDYKQQGFHSIYLNLGLAEKDILSDLDKSLRWLCMRISQELNIEPQLSLYWHKDLGSKSSCTDYFENYLLPLIKVPLVLTIDELDRVLENHEVFEELFSLFKAWQEKSQQLSIWEKMRLILVQSTETFVIKSLHYTPLKIGREIQVGCFETEEVESLIQLNKTNIKDIKKFKQVIEFLGQHPGLIGLTLYHLTHQNITLEKLLKTAATDTGIYQHHLQHYFKILQKFPDLGTMFNKLLTQTNIVGLDPILSGQLKSLGLIKQTNENTLQVSSQLYHSYFLNCF
ncbi:MAG: AAA-like domain-containing protein [Crocosphaera sp.]